MLLLHMWAPLFRIIPVPAHNSNGYWRSVSIGPVDSLQVFLSPLLLGLGTSLGSFCAKHGGVGRLGQLIAWCLVNPALQLGPSFCTKRISWERTRIFTDDITCRETSGTDIKLEANTYFPGNKSRYSPTDDWRHGITSDLWPPPTCGGTRPIQCLSCKLSDVWESVGPATMALPPRNLAEIGWNPGVWVSATSANMRMTKELVYIYKLI